MSSAAMHHREVHRRHLERQRSQKEDLVVARMIEAGKTGLVVAASDRSRVVGPSIHYQSVDHRTRKKT
jgi:hypothetical protein